MLDHLDDLASDFSAIHGIRDMLSLPGPVFFALAYRLSAYQGVMAARAAEEDTESGSSPQAAPEPRATAPVVQPTEADLKRDPVFGRIFGFSNASDHRAPDHLSA